MTFSTFLSATLASQGFAASTSKRCYSAIGYLGSLKPAPGSNKKKVRVGRGDSSGKGNTAGRGNKGQKARSGRPHPRFEGGQTPLTMAFPKRGFKPASLKEKPEVLPLGRLHHWIQSGRIDATQPITLRELHVSGCVNGIKAGGVKLLADAVGSTPTPAQLPPLQIIVNKASKAAIQAIEQAGGRIVCRYYNALGVRAVTKPEAFLAKGKTIPRLADPIKRSDIEYYHRPEKRGYLALQQLSKSAAPAATSSASEAQAQTTQPSA